MTVGVNFNINLTSPYGDFLTSISDIDCVVLINAIFHCFDIIFEIGFLFFLHFMIETKMYTLILFCFNWVPACTDGVNFYILKQKISLDLRQSSDVGYIGSLHQILLKQNKRYTFTVKLLQIRVQY